MEPSPIGDFVWAHMTEAERQTFRNFMRAADGSDEDDEGYCDLHNFGIGCCACEGEPIEERDIPIQLEYMARGRLLDSHMESFDWDFLMLLAAGRDKEGATRLARLFVLATGISDEEVFDEKLRSERRAREATRG